MSQPAKAQAAAAAVALGLALAFLLPPSTPPRPRSARANPTPPRPAARPTLARAMQALDDVGVELRILAGPLQAPITSDSTWADMLDRRAVLDDRETERTLEDLRVALTEALEVMAQQPAAELGPHPTRLRDILHSLQDRVFFRMREYLDDLDDIGLITRLKGSREDAAEFSSAARRAMRRRTQQLLAPLAEGLSWLPASVPATLARLSLAGDVLPFEAADDSAALDGWLADGLPSGYAVPLLWAGLHQAQKFSVESRRGEAVLQRRVQGMLPYLSGARPEVPPSSRYHLLSETFSAVFEAYEEREGAGLLPSLAALTEATRQVAARAPKSFRARITQLIARHRDRGKVPAGHLDALAAALRTVPGPTGGP